MTTGSSPPDAVRAVPAPAGLRERVPLASLTTLGVGGPARWLVEAADEAAILAALAWADARGIPVVVLGGGSNLLVADRGLDALVLRVRAAGVVPEVRGDRVLVRAGAGEPWDALVALSVSMSCAGLECLSGIPGDVGATPIQNVGAYGQEVAESIVEVRAIDRRSGRAVTLAPEECAFGYRDSVFKREAKDRYVVAGVAFLLRSAGAPSVRYPELARRLAAAGASPALADVRAAVLELRRAKSMLFDPSDENARSAGSFFTNPTVDAASLERVRERVRAAGVLGAGEAMPEFAAVGGRTKLSAAWLIERAGFTKGTREGRVGISTKHSLALVNKGGATAAELVAFARRVREGVLARFGVALVPEPAMVGFRPEELGDLVA